MQKFLVKVVILGWFFPFYLFSMEYIGSDETTQPERLGKSSGHIIIMPMPKGQKICHRKTSSGDTKSTESMSISWEESPRNVEQKTLATGALKIQPPTIIIETIFGENAL